MTLPTEILNSNEIRFALQVVSAVREQNFAKFFKLVKAANYLTACLMSMTFKSVRSRGLYLMVKT
jgi:hypothetical protein